jgi:hypothetical protein
MASSVPAPKKTAASASLLVHKDAARYQPVAGERQSLARRDHRKSKFGLRHDIDIKLN